VGSCFGFSLEMEIEPLSLTLLHCFAVITHASGTDTVRDRGVRVQCCSLVPGFPPPLAELSPLPSLCLSFLSVKEDNNSAYPTGVLEVVQIPATTVPGLFLRARGRTQQSRSSVRPRQDLSEARASARALAPPPPSPLQSLAQGWGYGLVV
jgi:hypothetical protein